MRGFADMGNGETMPEADLKECMQKFRHACEKMKLQVEFRQLKLKEWDEFLSLQPFMPIEYANDFIDYQLAWSACHVKGLQDLSIILHLEGKPAAIWPLCVRSGMAGLEIGSNEGAVLPPFISSALSPRSRKKLYARCYALISQISVELQTKGWKGVECIFMQDGLSDWHMMLMDGGARLSIKHDLYLDLSLDLSEIKSRMRRRYRSLITAGEKIWTTEIVRVPDQRIWREFQFLHMAVAGRRTRSQETWDLQLHSIALGKAFLVFLRDDKGCPVGGGFFQYTRDEALYAVGAYDRSLFDRPIGHVVQWNAIQEFKRHGIRWYRIGERTYRSDDDCLYEKMITISHFKEGFSTHCYPRAITLNQPLSALEQEQCSWPEMAEMPGS